MSAKLRRGSSKAKEEADAEPKVINYSLLFLGSHHKTSLFEKLIESVDRYERHLQYEDVWYLYLTVDDIPCLVELCDPGMAHTGAREMAIRKAEAAILCYSALNIASFHELSGIAEDFKLRGSFSCPIRLICNEDDVVEDVVEDEAASTAYQSSSEGYESEEPSSGLRSVPRRKSMEKIVEVHENHRITQEQGETMARQFGPDCSFVAMSVNEFAEAREMLEELIRGVNEKNEKKLKAVNKARRKSRSDRSTPTNSIRSDGSSSGSTDSSVVPRLPGKGEKIKKKVKNVSAVCTIS